MERRMTDPICARARHHTRTIMTIVFVRWQADCARIHLRRQQQRETPGRISSRTPVLVVTLVRGARIICACCAQAARAGVQPGMALAHARAICPPPRMEAEAHPERERAMLRSLARWCQRYSPITAIEPTDGPTAIHVDLTGCERVHPHHASLTARVIDELAARGFAVRVSVAPTAAAALALAQSGMSDLLACPLSALRIDAHAVAALAEVQVRTIGHLARLTRAAVASRYGSDVLQRLDLARGEALEILTPIRSQPPPSVEQIFDGPVTNHLVIAQSVAGLLEELCKHLRERVRGGREFELTAQCADAPPFRHAIMLAAASARPAHLIALFAPHLERIPMGMGIESIRIAVLRMGAWSAQSDRGGEVDQSLSEWADTLTAHLGDHALFRGGFAEHHDPARSIRWISLARCGTTARAAGRAARVRVAAAWRPSTWITPAESIEVTGAHTQTLRWRGRVIEVARWCGPERIASPWTRSASRIEGQESIDYWRVETVQGAWLWIAQRGTGPHGWLLMGIWS